MDVGKNPGVHKGKPVWSGAFDPVDGHVLEVHPYSRASDADFHHSHYFSDKAQNAMRDDRAQFFWLDPQGVVQTEWRAAGAKPEVVQSIQQQIQPFVPRDYQGMSIRPVPGAFEP